MFVGLCIVANPIIALIAAAILGDRRNRQKGGQGVLYFLGAFATVLFLLIGAELLLAFGSCVLAMTGVSAPLKWILSAN